MTFGSGPHEQAYNGQQPPAYPAYGNHNVVPSGRPQYQHGGYMPPGQPQGQPLPQQQNFQYSMNTLPPLQMHDGSINPQAAFATAPHYANAQFIPQMQAALPAYPTVPPLQQQQPQQHIMLPPPQRVQQTMLPAKNPQPAPPRRVSSGGAIQKVSKPPRKSLPTPAATSPSISSSVSIDTPSVLLCVADECIGKARAAVPRIAAQPTRASVDQYHKLIATGLSCLEAAIQTGKLEPRTEALVKLRYGSLLCEETENIMEAETTLQSVITLCEKVGFLARRSLGCSY
jgi:hypothetical protein